MQGSSLLPAVDSVAGRRVRRALAISTTAATRSPAKSPISPICRSPAAIRNCSTNKEIDCIVAAVPDHWHKQIVVDAVNAGKDIYCEKPMSHIAADGVEMVAAAQEERTASCRSVRSASVPCSAPRRSELVAQGMLGDLMMVEGWLGRNDPTGAWEYPPPPDLSPQTLDWDTWQGTVPKRRVQSRRSLRAGAAGRNTAPASPAICWST